MWGKIRNGGDRLTEISVAHSRVLDPDEGLSWLQLRLLNDRMIVPNE